MHQNLTPESWQILLAKQQEREDNALAAGQRRFRDALLRARDKGTESQIGGARKLLQHGIQPLEKAIVEFLEASEGRRGGRHVAIKWIKRVGVDVAAYMTVKVVLDGIGKRRRSYNKACREVSELILDELRYRRLQEQAPNLFEYKLKSFHTSSYAHMARSLDHTVRTALTQDDEPIDVSDLQMSEQHRVLVGAKLIELCEAATDLIQIDREKTATGAQRRGKQARNMVWLEATEETVQWLTKGNDKLSMLQPVKLPMVVPPLQWAPGRRGGFYFALLRKYSLVRGIRNRDFARRVATASLPLVYNAINAIQNTAWRINQDVLALVKEIQQRGGELAGIPRMNPLEEPARPADIDTNDEVLKGWKKRTGVVRDRNHIRKLKAEECLRVLHVVDSVLEEEAIYFPYSLDFRGRVYPLTDYLNPQGHDLSKALLTFAQGKAVDADGARWLAIHGANCMGETKEGQKFSKQTLDERVQWIHENTKRIIQAANDPFVNKWWADAEDPLQFYAFCIEWRNLLKANDRGETYICSLPVSLDGTCNGLQHFSAMLRDEVGGAAVNVLPQERPQDIYHAVSERVLAQVEELAPHDPLAAKWLGLHRKTRIIDRKLCKRPTMTFGYGSKRFGFRKQLKDELRSRDNWHDIKEHFGTRTNANGKEVSQISNACSLMADFIWQALEETVVKAFQGMKWMQDAARGIVAGKKAVEWVVPGTGFLVRQEYVKWKRHMVRTILAGSVVYPRVYTATDDLDPTKQANAISPNVVHSLDAAALMLTVSQAAADGVEAFAMVHDSYGSLPADCSVVARSCRQSFVRLYSSADVIDSLHKQFLAQYTDPDKCPSPPAKGSLDVNGVLRSDYFFA